MNLEELEKVIHIFERANITSLDMEIDGTKIKLTKTENQVCVAQNPLTKEVSVEDNLNPNDKTVKSPLVGTFHQAPYQDAAPFVSVGSKVKKGDKLCIIEAMKVMNEITAPKDGTVKEIYLKEGEIAEFDAPLFLIGE